MINYYKYAALIPSGLIITGYLVFALVYILSDLGSDYKSEWMTANDAVIYSLFLVFLNCMFVSLLSLPVFLNSWKRVKDQVFASFLSWFLLPGIWFGYLLGKHVSYLYLTDSSPDGETVFILSNTLPFLIGLVFSYQKHRMRSKR